MRVKDGLPEPAFVVRPARGSRRYFEVYIFDTLEEMRSAVKGAVSWDEPNLGAGVVEAYRKPDDGLLGMIFFAREAVGAGIVAHEMAHAAFRSLERLARPVRVDHWAGRDMPDGADMPTIKANEERFCDVLENLCASFWVQWFERGFDDNEA